MANRRNKTGNIRFAEKNITERILSSIGLARFAKSEEAWGPDMCREVVQYVPMRYLRFYLRTEDEWTSTWMEAVNNELSDRALFNTRYKKLPKKETL